MGHPATVARFGFWYDKAMEERFAREPAIDLVTIPLESAERDAWAVLSEARAYIVSAAKDELPRPFFVDAALIERCPGLLAVASVGAGYDTVDVAACTAAGVLAINQSGANAAAVAEHTLGLMLDLSKRISESDRRLRSGRGYSREDLMGREIGGKVLGIVGIGHIGRRVAALARAFGMEVLATDPLLPAEEIAARGASPVTLDELLARSDFVSLHCPRDAGTVNLIGAAAFARMKPGAAFVTTARGGVHEEAALLEALRSGHLAGAGIDVWDQEPPPLDHPLLRLPNVVATFHTAGVTREARRNMALWSSDRIIAALKGERPAGLLNPEAWPLFQRRAEAVLSVASD